MDESAVQKKSEEIRSHAEEAEKTEKLLKKYMDRTMDGTLIYGGPWDKKKKLAVQWAKETLLKEMEVVKSEVFEFSTPRNWIFFYSAKNGWYKIYVGMFLL